MLGWFKTLVIVSGLGLIPLVAYSQETPSKEVPGLVPIVTGYGGMVTSFVPGEQKLAPTINPILLVPLNHRLLIESEFEYAPSYTRSEGMWEKEYERNLEYLQADFIANRYMTVVLGRFINPIGIFNERLHPLWMRYVGAEPLIHPLEEGSGNGFQLRGGIPLASNLNLTYAGYFSVLNTQNIITAERAAGGRWSVFLPNQRLEIGTSFRRVLSNERANIYGLDGIWQAKPVPLDVRAEYAHSPEGSGYWLEGAYHLSQIPKARRFLRRNSAVVRMEQFFAPAGSEEMGASMGDMELPGVNTKRLWLGWTYDIRDGLRVGFSYGREFSPAGNRNLFGLLLGYRWVF